MLQRGKRIKIAEFRGRNKKENPMTTIEVEEINGHFYYINFKGEHSTRYVSLKEAINDITELYSKWLDFKILV